MRKAPIDILCIDETKLNDSFSDAQFLIENYHFPPFRKDRNNNGGGKMVFIRKELIAKQIQHFQINSTETIWIELIISKKKWCIIFTYRPPIFDKGSFFHELTNIMSQAVNNYDNILIAGDLNIDLSEPTDKMTITSLN